MNCTVKHLPNGDFQVCPTLMKSRNEFLAASQDQILWEDISQDREVGPSRRAHYSEITGSNPVPAT